MPKNPLSHTGHAIVPVPITVVPAFPSGTTNPDNVSVITWFDSRNKKRSIVVGPYLRRYDFSFNDGENEIHRTADADLNQKQGGFEYLVSHAENKNSPIGRDMPGEAKTFFLGEHHVIHPLTLNLDNPSQWFASPELADRFDSGLQELPGFSGLALSR